MTTYVYPNFATKKALKEAVAAGQRVTAERQTPRGAQLVGNSNDETISGPHYPKPHKWYATVQVKDGVVVAVLT